jgi:4-hydroxy-tetrahydrodipicolinate reductase
MLNLMILGADGKMGVMIARRAMESPEIVVTHACTIADSPNLGRLLGDLCGHPGAGPALVATESLESAPPTQWPDVVVDFTRAEGTQRYAPLLLEHGVATVIGTTGLPPSFGDDLKRLVATHQSAAVYASNMSVGVNILFQIAPMIARMMPDADIEVVEAHHNQKVDSPSGTALTIAEGIAEAIGQDLGDVARYGRPRGPSKRLPGHREIGIHAVRAGDIVGEHTVTFAIGGERIELTHRAQSRECFAAGAIEAIKFVHRHRGSGKVFSMHDVIAGE